MNKVILTLAILFSAALLVNSQYTSCVSNQWTWYYPQQQYDSATTSYLWVWLQLADPALEAEKNAWCAKSNGAFTNCIGANNALASACTYDPQPLSADSSYLHFRCFCSGNNGDNVVQSGGPGLCDTGFTMTETGCVEDCLVDPNQHCASCTVDHELCASCVPGWFLKADGTCVSDCGAGFYGSKLDWTCYGCDYHWVGRQSTHDTWCPANCFIPAASSFGMNPTCVNNNAISQTCKCLCPPDNTPNYVVGGAATVETQCQHNTYLEVVNHQITQTNVITRWWVPFTIKPLYAAYGQKFCENYCPGSNYCNIFCDPLP